MLHAATGVVTALRIYMTQWARWSLLMLTKQWVNGGSTRRYADQTGLRTSITPGSTIDGTVFQDSSAKKSIALLGDKAGGVTGSVNVVYNNIPTYLVSGGRTQVLLERMPQPMLSSARRPWFQIQP